MIEAQPRRQKAAWIDLVAGMVLLALCVVSFRQADLAAAQAAARYGHNVDSGAYLRLLALYLTPVAATFLLASVANFRGMRIGATLHGVAIGLIVLPFIAIVAMGVWDLIVY